MKNIFQKHPIITLISINMVVILLLDISIANIYTYMYGHSFHDKLNVKAKESNRLFRERSDIYDHDLIKNVSIDNAIAGNLVYKIRTDSLGFINNSVKEVPLISDEYRILFIGDSFTEGWGFEYDETFVGIISHELTKRNIEVLNAAVISYSPIIYWRKIKYLLEDAGLKI